MKGACAPKTGQQLKREAKSLGLSTDAIPDTPREKLISSIYSSKEINREIGHATILLFGPSGTGKSATINHVFNLGGDLAKTSDSYSATRKITEYKIINDYQEYDVKDISLGVIDSPGVSDTSGLKQDACNLAAIRSFFKERKKVVPNLIFILVNPLEKKFDGPNSSLERSLKCLESLKLVDKDHLNVVGILTHAGLFPKKKDMWIQKFEDRKKRLKQLILKNLKVTVDVVALENFADEQELKTFGDFTILPDGTRQPKNLYNVCAELLTNNGDDFGLIAFNAAFRGKPKEISIGNVLEPKDASVNKLEGKEKKYFEFCHSLFVGYEVELDVPSSEEEDNADIERDSDGLDIGVKFLAQGYHIFNDETSLAPIFTYMARKNNFGIRVPDCAHLSKINTTQTFEEVFSSEEDKICSKMIRFNIRAAGPKVGATAGFNTEKRVVIGTTSQEFSVVIEHRILQAEIENFRDLTFTEQFKEAVENLPQEINQSAYEKFLDDWGCHIIARAYCGGSIEIKVKSESFGSEDRKMTQGQLVADIHDLCSGTGVAEDQGASRRKLERRKRIFHILKAEFKGGDTSLHDKDTLRDPIKLKEWRESIKMNPAMLNRDLKLTKISEFVGYLDKGKQYFCNEAIKKYLEEYKRDDILIQPNKNKPCFPGSAIVQKKTDGVILDVEMNKLAVGDLIHTKQGFSKILLFAHYAPDKVFRCLKIHTVDEHCVRLTGNHLVFVSDDKHTKLAYEVQPGDKLISQDKEKTSEVVSVEEVTEVGLFCPITEDGTIYVDGILTSCYASCKPFFNIDAHHLAHLGLLPMRIARMKSGQVEEMHPYIKFLDELPLPFRM